MPVIILLAMRLWQEKTDVRRDRIWRSMQLLGEEAARAYGFANAGNIRFQER
jgi:hypothetical protein